MSSPFDKENKTQLINQIEICIEERYFPTLTQTALIETGRNYLMEWYELKTEI